ncbi:hypothetical protein [Desulfovibrio litoralis]|uniref:Uncharacterized protein n=1 Tax=Desulfovibrio litoralis DSM 11393 TaxID=1121455 RepID=A0A1M7SPY5_9BACT|nr:hypothetical protein [Desulfovibrio litoralis]SHN60494.1 hypothetical protein SAMN02745728_01134 [Desulfovibrio litoralis DSM 11393]
MKLLRFFLRFFLLFIILIIPQILWGLYFVQDKIIAETQSCTCPDVHIIWGQKHIDASIPEELKQYDFDTTEAYLEERRERAIPLFLNFQPVYPIYVFTGTVIGKDRVSEHDPWNPVIKADKIYTTGEQEIQILFILQGIILFILLLTYTVLRKLWSVVKSKSK